MALAKRDFKKSQALSKAETDPKDDDDEDKKKKDAAADDVAKADDSDKDSEDDDDTVEKADGEDDSDDDSDEDDDEDDLDDDDEEDEYGDDDDDEEDEYGDDEETDDDMPIGEFRIEVMPNGMVRIHKDDLNDDDDSDEDNSEKSDDDTDQPQATTNDQEDVPMGKSASASSAPTATSVAVTEESLKKALQTLMGVAKASESPASMMARAQSKEGITKSEAKQLLGKVAGRSRRSASLGDSVAKSFTEDAALSKAHGSAQDSDVGDYLEALTERTAKSSALLADSLEGSVHQLTSQNERFHSVMAKALGQSLAALKLISERMGVIESQPTRAPKSLSATPVEAAQKSFGGSIPSASLGKAEMLDTLTRMNLDSMKAGRQGMSKGHRPLMNGIEAAMNDQTPDAGLLEEVISFRQATV